MAVDKEKRILLFLERREIYLLEKILNYIKNGRDPEPLLKEMEDEKEKRREKIRGRKIAKRAFWPGIIILCLLFSSAALINFPQNPKITLSSLTAVKGSGKIIISYYFNEDYLDLIGYDWEKHLGPVSPTEMKIVNLYINMGGRNTKKILSILKRIYRNYRDPYVRSRVLYLMAQIHEEKGKHYLALAEALHSLSLAGDTVLAYDPLTLVLKLLSEHGKISQMKKYLPLSMDLLNRDFYYPLFKFSAFYILETEREANFRTKWVIYTLMAILENFPSNLQLANDFVSTLSKGKSPLCSLAIGMVYSSLGFREGKRVYLKRFLIHAQRNPGKYGEFIILARKYLNAP